MKFKLLSIAAIALFTHQVFAGNNAVEPTTCPSVSAISAAGVNVAIDSGIVGWVAMNTNNNFQTEQEWSFTLIGLAAKDESDALLQANKALSSLSLYEGPSKNENEWGCAYAGLENNEFRYIGIAVTPPLKIFNTANILRFKK